MINSRIESSGFLDFGNQQERGEDKGRGIKKEEMVLKNDTNNIIMDNVNGDKEIERGIERRGERMLRKFVNQKIVKKYGGLYPDFPLGKFGRINMQAIMEHEGLSESERKEVEKKFKKCSKLAGEIGKREGLNSEVGPSKETFERAEKLLMAIIYKVIGDKVLVFRSSPFDDWVNGVDLIIAEPTGEKPICVLDVTVFHGEKGDEWQQKMVGEKKKKKNLSEGGAKLDFFGLKDRERREIPFFCISLRREITESCLDDFTFSLSKKELEIFFSVITSIKEQITKLRKRDQSFFLTEALKKQIDNLRLKIKEWEKSYYIESEIEKGKVVLNIFICTIANENMERYPGFPLTESGQIDIEAIMNQEDLSEKDKKEIKEEHQNALVWRAETGRIGRKLKEARRSEKLSMAIIHKIIGDRFFIFRSALPDDINNGVDIVIAERTDKGPIPVCVLDITNFRVRDPTVPREEQLRVVKEKIKDAYEKNLLGGAQLNFFGSKDRKKSNIPIFCIPLEEIERSSCLDNFTFPLSKRELDIFNIFITSIEEQIAEFKKFKKYRSSLVKRQVIKLEGIGQLTKKEITELEKESRSIKGQITKLDRKVRSIQRQVTELKSKSQPSLDLLGNQMSNLEKKVGEWKDSYKEKLKLVEGTNKKL